ncbi:ABC transporter ATP-binding protein [Clostridium sp. 'deep sea']|uniref:ABC transporter ATP-binding protein n=1 Tax=Clostridium sp. 'deep sea' TaxID=2779445 RepID=UPI0018967560|nr:ABC transporter ATP-binding protein [Clostridium sp. 'deep sea']QOR35382.1 ABC transporter ATP-binding protein [Clostridium sp. 'deep sea']
MSEYILQLKNVTKVYGNGVVANKDVNFALKKGEIHAVVGENGAGKSTLMKILFGMEQPNGGEILLNGQKTVINDSNKAIELGIGMVHQHFMLVPSFTVSENLLLGLEPNKGLFIDLAKSKQISLDLAKKYNFKIDPDLKAEDLTVGMKQKVEILKVLLRGAKIIILDEPTAVLTPQETVELFVQLKKLKEEGHTIIFISHKLKEVKEISDRVTIIRKGQTKGTFKISEVSERKISNLMVGRDVVLSYDKPSQKTGDVKLRVNNLSFVSNDNKQILKDISFSVKAGQILGIAGVEGNGQTELINMITRNKAIQSGKVFVNDELINNLDIISLRNKGFSYIPEDRMSLGIAGSASIEENIITNRILANKMAKKVLLKGKQMAAVSNSLIEQYSVLCSSKNQAVNSLSGGNIQKVVVARECSINPQVLIAEQPTRGVDVGSIEFIHHKLLEMRKNNTAILLVSADLNEVMELSDQIIVMYEGEIVAYFEDSKSLTEEKLGMAMLGIERHTPELIRRAYHD